MVKTKKAAPAPAAPEYLIKETDIVRCKVAHGSAYKKFGKREGSVRHREPNAPEPDLITVDFFATPTKPAAWSVLKVTDLEFVRHGEPAAAPAPSPEPTPAAAPTPSVQYELMFVPLASIDIVRNTRQHYDEQELAGLAQSIKETGVLTPVSMRPHPTEVGRYQLAAGHRRFLASQLAGVDSIPAAIRSMTDHELLEIQVLENLQRQDVHPADEAAAFAELLANDFSAEEIGARVGKSPRFVAQRARLVTLLPFWMEHFRAGSLPVAAANMVARQSLEVQEKLSTVSQSYLGYASYQKNPEYSAQEIQNYLNREVMRELKLVPWDLADASLLPKAGACTQCPKRTSRNALLFSEFDASESCLDRDCFASKIEAHLKRKEKELKNQAEGGPAPLLVSKEYSPRRKDVLSYQHWDMAKEGDAGAVPVLVVDGADAGHVVYAKLHKSAAQNSESAKAINAGIEEQQKKERQAQNRKQRIEATERILQASTMYHYMCQKPVPDEQVLHWLNGQIFRYGGPHRDMRSALVRDFGFPEPKGGTVKMESSAIKVWVNPHLQSLSYEYKLALYFALLTYNENQYRLAERTQQCGGDLKSIKAKATRRVDKEPDMEEMTAAIESVMNGKEAVDA